MRPVIFEIFSGDDGFYFRVKRGQITAHSESYTREADAFRAARSLRDAFKKSTVVIRKGDPKFGKKR